MVGRSRRSVGNYVVTDAKKHSATDSTLGYFYQCRFALLDSLRRLRVDNDDFLVSIETLEDVTFQSQGRAAELLQLKHHNLKSQNLSNASVDLWRTLRNWCEDFASGVIHSDSILYLITTASVSSNSAPAFLMSDGRNEDFALQELIDTANTSTNETNKNGYKAFLTLNPAERTTLVKRIIIIDNSPNILNVEDELKREVRWAAPSQFLDALVVRLEGWWFGRVIEQLTDEDCHAIQSQEIESEMSNLREAFQDDNLPIDVLDLEIDHDAFLSEQFVHQLELIDVTNPRIRIAIREYFRAFEQRSRWVREDLLHVGELGKYERRLIEEWEILFEQMKQDLGEDAAEEQKKRAAQALYKWVESKANFPIRKKCDEAFVTRGTFHILANGDRPKVGWHPDFLQKIRSLLEAETGE
jgi:hypothetical protein